MLVFKAVEHSYPQQGVALGVRVIILLPTWEVGFNGDIERSKWGKVSFSDD